MEFMKLDGFLGDTISKLINKWIETKYGYRPDISLSGFNLKSDDGIIEINATIRMRQLDFESIFEEVTR